MEKWVVYAFLSMFFAGFTAVIAKLGLVGISSDLGVTIRTLFVSVFVVLFALWVVPAEELGAVDRHNIFWLGCSGVSTALSWIFYYKALKSGDVATVALIDKASVIIAMLLAWLILREAITLRMLLGGSLIMTGVLVIAKK